MRWIHDRTKSKSMSWNRESFRSCTSTQFQADLYKPTVYERFPEVHSHTLVTFFIYIHVNIITSIFSIYDAKY